MPNFEYDFNDMPIAEERNGRIFQWYHEGNVSLVDYMGSDDTVCHAARVSTLGEEADKMVAATESNEGLIRYLARNRHGSPFEHAVVTFLIKAPIFVIREYHRHRVASYNEESGRYKQLEPHFYLPSTRRPLVQTGSSAHPRLEAGSDEQHSALWNRNKEVSLVCYDAYEYSLRDGIAREVARQILPLNIMSSFYVTMNLRALMNFLSLRVNLGEQHVIFEEFDFGESLFVSNPMDEISVIAQKMEVIFCDLFPMVHGAFIKSKRVAP